jgi:transcriptional regulator with GAF, ATPase, and Fis domain
MAGQPGGTHEARTTPWSEAHARTLLELLTAVSNHRRREPLFGAIARALEHVIEHDVLCIVLDGPAPGFISPYYIRPPLVFPPRPRAQSALDQLFVTGRPVLVASPESVADRPGTLRMLEMTGTRSYVALPLHDRGEVAAALVFQSARAHAYDDLDLGFATEVASILSVALANCSAYERLDAARERLTEQNAMLRDHLDEQFGPARIIGRSPALLEVLRLVGLVAPTDATVLVTGETGTGKELIARAVHEQSPRAARPLVTLNCAAIPAGLVESEMFGHEQGAFTDASKRRRGRFEQAHRGTLFLDEIGELPAEAQAKLLRVLQQRELERVGGTETIKVDVRVIAATNRDLAAMVKRGQFRADLYYRLAVFPLAVPPLRERKQDLPMLARGFAFAIASRLGRQRPPVLDELGLSTLAAYDWPGNVRELHNVIERAVVLSRHGRLDVELLLPAEPHAGSTP